MELSTAAVALWLVALVVAYLSVPLLVLALTRIRNASTKIAGYAHTTREASRGIAENLKPVGALERTEELLGAAHGIADELAAGTEGLGEALLRRAGGAS